ncbi:hypothetical protein ACYCEV_03935 [Aerococcus mictus]
MSNVFKNKLDTFKSDLTGEEREYTANNYLWLVLQDKFGMTQSEFNRKLDDSEDMAVLEITTAILIANGLDVTVEEVAENTTPEMTNEFYTNFIKAAYPSRAEYLEMAQQVNRETEIEK